MFWIVIENEWRGMRKKGKLFHYLVFFYKYWYYWSWAQVVSNSRNSLFGMKNRNETSKEELSWFILFPFHCTWWNKASKMTIYIHKKMTILSLIFFFILIINLLRIIWKLKTYNSFYFAPFFNRMKYLHIPLFNRMKYSIIKYLK